MFKRIFCFVYLMTSVASINAMERYFKRKKMEDSRKKELFYKQKNGKLERNKKHLQKKLQNRKDLSKLSKDVANKIKTEKVGENKIDLSSMVPMGPQNLSNGSKEQVLMSPKTKYDNFKITGSSVVYNEKEKSVAAWMMFESKGSNFYQTVMVIKDLEGEISGSKVDCYSDGVKKISHLTFESPYVKRLLKGIYIVEKKRCKFLFHGDF